MFWTVTRTLLEGFGTTVQIFALTLVFALPLGLVVAAGSMSKWAPVRGLGRADSPAWVKALASLRPISALVDLVVWVIRGTPLMLQLYVMFYVPGMVTGTNPWGSGAQGRITATLVAFVINYAIYFSEIFRGGIESIPKGQYEAGQVLGMTRSQIFFKIVLLQVIKRIMAPIGNEVINLVKDTSLARVIAVTEVLKSAQDIVNGHAIIWPLFYTAVFYLAAVGLIQIVLGLCERKLSYYKG